MCHPALKPLIFHLACQIEAPGAVRSQRLLIFCFSIILAKEISELPSSLPHSPRSWRSAWPPFSSRPLPSADELLLLPCVTLRQYYWKVKLMSKEMSRLVCRSIDCLLLPQGVVLDIIARSDVAAISKGSQQFKAR